MSPLMEAPALELRQQRSERLTPRARRTPTLIVLQTL
jgi:hypothetical protein